MADLRIRKYDVSKAPHAQSNYGRRISTRKWTDMMPVIIDLFHKGLTKKVILERLNADYGFSPTMPQLVSQMKSWQMVRYKIPNSVTSIAESKQHHKVFGFCYFGHLRPNFYFAHFKPALTDWGRRNLSSVTTKESMPGRTTEHLWAVRQSCLAVLLDDENPFTRHSTPVPKGMEILKLGKLMQELAGELSPKVSSKPVTLWSIWPEDDFKGIHSKVSGSRLNLKHYERFTKFYELHVQGLQCRLNSHDEAYKYDMETILLFTQLVYMAMFKGDFEEAKLHARNALHIFSGLWQNYTRIMWNREVQMNNLRRPLETSRYFSAKFFSYRISRIHALKSN